MRRCACFVCEVGDREAVNFESGEGANERAAAAADEEPSSSIQRAEQSSDCDILCQCHSIDAVSHANASVVRHTTLPHTQVACS